MGHWEWAVATLIGVVSIARTVRLLVYDDFPPVAWLRARFLALFPEDSKWSVLIECQYCVAPYLAAGMGLWAWVSDLNTWWWVINGWWAASYAAAILVSYDQPADD